MERGDIYLVSLDPTLGHEQKGTRPVLVVSPGAFNRADERSHRRPDHQRRRICASRGLRGTRSPEAA